MAKPQDVKDPKDQRPLFRRFPALEGGIPQVRLADLPTPLRRMDRLGGDVGVSGLWLKDDGPSSPIYGGNKVRKLEGLLAAARDRGARSVVTFGYAGSNHATATAVHASRLGMQSVSILLPQRGADYLRRNLLVSAAVGAELREYPTRPALMAGAALTLARRRLREGRTPEVIAPGGSSPLGTVGFVNAAFELAAQFDALDSPLPRTLYAAAGTMGTVVGLGIGLAALGLPVQVVAVRVVEERFVNPSRARHLWEKTVALLRAADPSFPGVDFSAERVEFRDEWFGGEYALVTDAAAEAMRLASDLEGLELDGTYTAKALACLIADARAGRFTDGQALFWNTRNSADLSSLAAQASPADLPRRLRRYFNDENPDA